ncbi:MAG: T9SS type A sorting domain-containing protein [Flavobacteriales bacterium]|jgi:hypothetical protein|nr:T9SS type A sorting domain-containing protein [Flavobacteriales bacterium]
MKNFIQLFSFLLLLINGSTYSQCPSGPSSSCNGNGTSLNLYWVGTDASNNGNWNTPCSWRVGSVAGVEPCQAPRSIDNVFFTSGSFAGSGGTTTITINTQARCNNFYVGSTINTLLGTPTFTLNNPGFLEVYGSLTLQTNMNWNVVGGNSSGPELLFKSTNSGNTIATAGHNLSAVQFDGIGGEWALQDDFNAGSLNFVFGHLTTNDGFNDHDLNLLTFDSDVKTGGTSTNRILDLNSSIVTISGTSGNDRYPYNTTNAPNSSWEGRGTTPSNFSFNAGSSQIIFTTTSPFVRLGGMNYNVINHTGTGRFYDHFGPNPCNIDTLITNGYLYFHHEHIFNVLQINSVGLEHNFFRHQTITGDLIAAGNPCNPTRFRSEYNRLLTMPSSVSADPMNGFIIDNLRCNDGTGGHTVSGFGIGTTTGWNITAPTARDLYWVGNTNTNWTEPTNWSTSPSGTPLLTAGDCAPLQTDNVFFTPMANGKTVHLNATANCNNMTWTISAPTTFSGSAAINVYGNMQLDTDINFTTNATFNMKGEASNTIFTAGKTINWMYFRDRSQYTLLDHLNFNYVYFFRQNSFNSGGYNLTGLRLYFRGSGSTNLSNSTVTLSNNNPWYLAGGQSNMTYNSNSNVIFTSTSSDVSIYGWGGNPHFPNFTLQNANSTLRIRDHLKNRTVTYDGNVTLNGSARFYADLGTGTTDGNITSLTINGDLNLSSGKTYEFGITNNLTVTNTVNSVAPCFSEPITIKGINGNPFNANFTGAINFAFTLIGNSNSLNPHTVSNCSDLGGNTNWTFNPPASTFTYYWRALNGSGNSIYSNPWNTPGHWTTNPVNTEGNATCIPGPYDNVVFDNLSFNGSTSNIAITGAISCNNITATGSNVNLTNSGRLMVNGNVASDGTMSTSNFSGNWDFISNTTGNTIDFGGTTLGSDLTFVNSSGAWTVLNNKLATTKDVYINGGTLNTNGQNFEMRRFHSSNSSPRTLNLSNSIVNISGNGNYLNPNSPGNVYTWNTITSTNFSLNPGTSVINFTNTNNPILYSGALNLHHVNFTSTSSVVSTSPMLIGSNIQTEYMKFDCSARIYGSHSYDTLEFTAGNVYRLEGGQTQTLNAPNGLLIATGAPGNEIAIKSTTTGSVSNFHKLNTGGSMLSFCFDYVSVEDNLASSDDPAFSFFTGVNSNNISATGIWDFTRPLVFASSIDADADVVTCPGANEDLIWNLNGSGPYIVQYTINGGTATTVTIPNSASTFTLPASHYADATYNVTAFSADNCGVPSAGTIIDSDVLYDVPNVADIAQNGDRKSCFLDNDNTLVHFQDELFAPQRIIASINDASAGTGLGNTLVRVSIDPVVQFFFVPPHHNFPYLQRRFGITPTNQELATIRLYFTQAELNALSTAYGTTLGVNDLDVTKFSNNVMDFSGGSSLMTITSAGTVPASVTSSSNVLYLEFQTSTFSHFVIHPKFGAPLPVELTHFDAQPIDNSVHLSWTTTTEINSDYFDILRSTDAENWEFIGKLNAAGNSSIETDYQYTDTDPIAGDSYYKLIQYDLDGNTKEYGPRHIYFKTEQITEVYPNPANNIIHVNYHLNNYDAGVSIQIYNSIGQMIKSINTTGLEGNNNIEIPIHEINSGIYTVRILSQHKTISNNIPLIIEK